MPMYFVKQGDISERNKPELYPFESKQLPDSKSGLSQFRKLWNSVALQFKRCKSVNEKEVN